MTSFLSENPINPLANLLLLPYSPLWPAILGHSSPVLKSGLENGPTLPSIVTGEISVPHSG